MVAYSFQTRFVRPILAGTKCQTIRGHRKRHARPGEGMQLYTGMRTRQCRLITRAECVSVHEIEIFVHSFCLLSVDMDGVPFEGCMNDFAIADGFTGLADMWGFWNHVHGWGDFTGVLLRWSPLPRDPEHRGDDDRLGDDDAGEHRRVDDGKQDSHAGEDSQAGLTGGK